MARAATDAPSAAAGRAGAAAGAPADDPLSRGAEPSHAAPMSNDDADDDAAFGTDLDATEIDLRPPSFAPGAPRRGSRATLVGRPPAPGVLMSDGVTTGVTTRVATGVATGVASSAPGTWQCPIASSDLRVVGAALSHVGMVRADNEDAFLIWPDAHLMVIADGMGGHRAGDVASRVAIDCLREHLVRGGVPLDQAAAEDRIVSAVHAAHEQINALSDTSADFKGMGTTLVVLWLLPDGALAVHVGDSRLYRDRDGVLEQVTGDHSLASELKRRGILDTQGLAAFKHKNVLTQALGGRETLRPEARQLDVRRGDRFLLCTDGLSDLVPHDALHALLASDEPPGSQAQSLVDRALGAGGRDNVTVIVAHVV